MDKSDRHAAPGEYLPAMKSAPDDGGHHAGGAQGHHGQATTSRGLMSELAQNTSMHGVPNIQRSPNLYRKVIWLVVVLAGIGMMSWKVTEAFIKYYSYPVETKVGFYYSPHLDFPAVTVCNLNPVKESAIAQLSDELYGDVGDSLGQFFSNNSAKDSSNWTDRPTRDWDDDAQDYMDDTPETDILDTYLSFYSQLDYNDRFLLGHRLNDIMLDCAYQGRQCGPVNFTKFNTYQYGNCYTFNLNATLETTKVGPYYGLRLGLYVEQDEYVSLLAPAAGFRVNIHNQSSMPFMEDEGFSIMPGTVTSVGIKKVVFQRAKPPYGTCGYFGNAQNARLNGFLYQIDSIGYTSQACKKTCYQKSLLQNCNCFDSRYPYHQNITAYSNFSDYQRIPCDDYDNETVHDCVARVEYRYKSDELACSTQCPIECESTFYKRFSSSAMYPSNRNENDVLDILVEHSDRVREQMEGLTPDLRETFVRDNVVALEVYFEDLNYEFVQTSASYLSLSLLSDLGGQAGLWLGLSIIAFFEVVELVIDVVQVLYVKTQSKKRVNDSQISLHEPTPDHDNGRPDIGQSAFHLSMTSRAPSAHRKYIRSTDSPRRWHPDLDIDVGRSGEPNDSVSVKSGKTL